MKWFGDARDWVESAFVAAFMFVVVLVYAILAYGTDFTAWSPWEIGGTWMITTSIWLCRTQNVLNWVWGVIGTVLIGKFMLDIDLTGQMLLNWAYFVPVSLWGWYWWVHKGETAFNFPPSFLNSWAWLGLSIGIAGGAAILAPFITYLNPATQMPFIDSLIVVASVVAQVLLGLKKVESWWLWLGPVNALAIYLFWSTGAYVLAGLYVVYFIHAAWAIWTWTKEYVVSQTLRLEE